MLIYFLVAAVLVAVVSVVDFSAYFLDEDTEKLLYVEKDGGEDDNASADGQAEGRGNSAGDLLNSSGEEDAGSVMGNGPVLDRATLKKDSGKCTVSSDILDKEAEALINSMQDVGR